MNFKTNSKKICIFIALILFVNPILASEDSLFLNGSSLFSTVLDESSTVEISSATCHEESKSESSLSDTTISNQNSSHDTEMQSHDANDCCADICLCDDAGCHVVSLIFNDNSQSIFSSNEITNFNLPIYLSLTSLPNSPPPII